MTPRPGQRIEITPDTRLGDLLGRRVAWRCEEYVGWRRGKIAGISRHDVTVETAHGYPYRVGWDEIYEVTK